MKIALTIAISLATAPGALAGGDPLENKTTVETTLSEVRETPEAFKQVKVRFPLQFASVGRVANPFFTRFVPSEYTNFYGWAAEQPIWRKDEYSNVFAYLFLSKASDQLQELYDLELYDRLMVTGVVRNTFQGAPWIEVLEFDVLGGHVSTESLAHAYRGEQMMARRQRFRSTLSPRPIANRCFPVLPTVNALMPARSGFPVLPGKLSAYRAMTARSAKCSLAREANR